MFVFFPFFCRWVSAVYSFSRKIDVDKSLTAPEHNTSRLTLGPCFPPAVGRGARPRQRRQKGAASEKPAHLLCEHEEDRNRRRPHPRGPNAEKPLPGAYCFAQQRFQTHVSFLIRRSKSSSTQKADSAPLNFDITQH